MIRCAAIGTNFVADWFMKAVQVCDGITCSLIYSRNRETAKLLYSKITNNCLPSQIQGEDGTLVIDNITNICHVVFHDGEGNTEAVIDLPPDHTLDGEVNDWLSMITTREGIQQDNESSLMELRVMDEARRQAGIIFPADRE